ncbi:GIY-YIG nuclease family protein [Ruminococcus sp.]|uniref:GIY-YIG nuclease family protein n=1 Tax=Ruminococcus sp. TaxID=41978 RepID=UPI00258A2E13|nr:GIY-YIG nuclease family protein [Ruminococcus sp.]MCR5021976.1 GIY-YIG nuclease family protein [Ruminococcus sp.]
MLRDFQLQAMNEWYRIKALGINDIIYEPNCILYDRSPYIYLFYDKNNIVIYIGHTQNIAKRMSKHIEESPFWKEVSYIMCAETPDLNSLADYERYYIQKYKPKYNKKGFKTPPDLPNMVALNFIEYKGKEVLNYVKK